MTDLTWEEPPPAKQRSFAGVGDALRARPGQWARIAEYPGRPVASMLVVRIRTGAVRYWQPAGSFEAVSRTVDDKTCVFARYVGDGEVSDQ
jgi:hypothetical protein